MNHPTPHQKNLESLCRRIYPRPFVSFPPVPESEEAYREYLTSNRLIHLTPQGREEYRSYFTNLVDGLKLVNKVVGPDFLLIKTVSSYPHVTWDIDIVMKNEKAAKLARKKLAGKWNLPLLIDINHIISWTQSREISDEFIWQHTKIRNIGGIPVRVPDETLDTLIRVGHIPFELAQVRLGELMHIFETSKSVDWNVLRAEAEKNGWPRTFKQITMIINSLHASLYGEPLTRDASFDQIPNVRFPHQLSYGHLAAAVLEKRAWKKIWGARLLIQDRLLGSRDNNPLIVLSGMDGTGKTTLAAALQRELRRRGIEAEFIHGHAYVVTKKSFGATASAVERFRIPLSLLTPFAFMNNLLTYYVRYRRGLRRTAIISDRYLYDKIARLIFYRLCPRYLGALYLRLLPKPDHFFVLDARIDTVIRRKGEYTKEEYERFASIYKFLAKTLHAPIINTEDDVESCVAKMTTVIFG